MNWSASAAAWRSMLLAEATPMEPKSISTLTMAIPGSNGPSRLHRNAPNRRRLAVAASDVQQLFGIKSEVCLAELSRRSFLAGAALSSASMALKSKCEAQASPMDHSQHGHAKPERPLVPRLPALISKVTATSGIDSAFRMLLDGSDTLDAALHVCKTQEDDPKDCSAGLGGLPNVQGEVQLDACC